MDFLKNFGHNIKSYRQALSLNQITFAEKIDKSLSTVGRLEIGQIFVSAKTLEKIAEVLQVEIEDLFRFPKTHENSTKKELINTLVKLAERLDESDLEYFNASMHEYIKTQKRKSTKIDV